MLYLHPLIDIIRCFSSRYMDHRSEKHDNNHQAEN